MSLPFLTLTLKFILTIGVSQSDLNKLNKIFSINFLVPLLLQLCFGEMFLYSIKQIFQASHSSLKFLFTRVTFSLNLSYRRIMPDKTTLIVWVLQDAVRLITSRAIYFVELSLFKSLFPVWMIIVSGFCSRVGIL